MGFNKYCYCVQIKENKMDGACSTRWRDKKCAQYFGEMEWRGVYWIHLAQDKDQ